MQHIMARYAIKQLLVLNTLSKLVVSATIKHCMEFILKARAPWYTTHTPASLVFPNLDTINCFKLVTTTSGIVIAKLAHDNLNQISEVRVSSLRSIQQR